jgi:hypothetical protein
MTTDTLLALRRQYGRLCEQAERQGHKRNQSLEHFFYTVFMAFDLLPPEEQQRLLDMVHRIRELQNKLGSVQIWLPEVLIDDSYAERMRQLIARAERGRRSQPYPPPLPPPQDLLQALAVQVRTLERDIAQWEDVRRSPDALRWLLEQGEAVQARLKREHATREQERDAQRRAQAQEQVRRLIEECGLSPLAGGLNTVDDALRMYGLPAAATPEVIKARYGVLLRRLHPDTNEGDDSANALMAQVLEAMQMLRAAGRA